MTSTDTIQGLFDEQLSRTPDNTAVVTKLGRLSYAGLDEQAEGIAALLQQADIRPGARVAIMLERTPQLPAAILAAFRCGSTCICLDPGEPERRLATILEDAAPTVAIASTPLPASHPAASLPTINPNTMGRPGTFNTPRRQARSGDPAFVFYTTGSTGRPKGVVIPHTARADRLRWETRRYGFTPDDVMMGKSSARFPRAS